MRRKAWLLDSPARRTGSDGDGRLRQEDYVGRPCRPGSMSGEVWRSRWRPEAVAQQATCATPCEGADGSWREREMRVVLATEQGGVREGRRSRSSPEEPSPQSMAFASRFA
jgi:hypothetical protein